MWGDAYTVVDNGSARDDAASGGSAYEHVPETGTTGGVTRGHVWNKGKSIDPEPRALWCIVVGSIAALALFGKVFSSARA